MQNCMRCKHSIIQNKTILPEVGMERKFCVIVSSTVKVAITETARKSRQAAVLRVLFSNSTFFHFGLQTEKKYDKIKKSNIGKLITRGQCL